MTKKGDRPYPPSHFLSFFFGKISYIFPKIFAAEKHPRASFSSADIETSFFFLVAPPFSSLISSMLHMFPRKKNPPLSRTRHSLFKRHRRSALTREGPLYARTYISQKEGKGALWREKRSFTSETFSVLSLSHVLSAGAVRVVVVEGGEEGLDTE